MDTSVFNKKYAEYWSNTIEKSVDGLKVPGLDLQAKYLSVISNYFEGYEDPLQILDVGCCHGRNFELLKMLNGQVHGIDISQDIIQMASEKQYTSLKTAGMEDIPYPDNYFDFLYVWAVFDLVKHTKALIEANRVMKIGAKILLTGKSANYFSDDTAALVAERNAKLKQFPHKFIDVNQLVSELPSLGYEVLNLYKFPRRGDLAENTSIDSSEQYYEFILILEKRNQPLNNAPKNFAYEFSYTAHNLSQSNGFGDVLGFFEQTDFISTIQNSVSGE
ncbi:class I SAM-dependent methyltransferase [Catenovulum sp. SM1970]|uniref:class I SAM-dependent methyltransferase n=1 Tax=Marinifaba aquimaris TaxID=2741323 RepID=UPI0015733846|nr:class I SAM-dependent methyltransferase [Marinifaba aquimaris]NTS75359.1 class I SAM-dependent methyltransferase [Marinifaba aquimaris]